MSDAKITNVLALVEGRNDAGSFDLSLTAGEVTLKMTPGTPVSAAPDPSKPWSLELTKGDISKLDNILLLLTYKDTLKW